MKYSDGYIRAEIEKIENGIAAVEETLQSSLRYAPLERKLLELNLKLHRETLRVMKLMVEEGDE